MVDDLNRKIADAAVNTAESREVTKMKTGFRVTFPSGSYSKSNCLINPIWRGVMTSVVLENKCTHGTLTYKFKFSGPCVDTSAVQDTPRTPQPWIRGGKLPGLQGGVNVTDGGNEKAKNGEGFAVRPMWRANGMVEIYAYFAGMNEDDYGERIGTSMANTLKVDEEYCVHLTVDIGNLNRLGSVELKIIDSGKKPVFEVQQHKMQFVKNKQLEIEKIGIVAFYGGADRSWAPYTDQILDLSDFSFDCQSR